MKTSRALSVLAPLLASVFALVGFASDARAEQPAPFTLGAQPVWYWMAGITGGASVVSQSRGGFLGGETSIVRLSKEGRFFGVYGDGYYDFGINRTYVTLGPELGYKIFGIDGGAAARLGGERVEWGATGRAFISLGILSFYGRYAHFIDPIREGTPGSANVIQIGAMLKFPLAVWGLE